MRALLRSGAEIVLLFIALFCLLPYIPSHPMQELPFFPLGAVAIAAFVGSRALRWDRRWPVTIIEGSAFATFALILHEAQEILLNS